MRAQYWKQDILEDKPEYTWKQAVTRFINESQHKRSLRTDIGHFRILDPYFSKYTLNQLNKSTIDEFIASQTKRDISVATRNRYLALLRSVLNKAYKDWEWIEKAPHIRLDKESNHVIRWITKNEAYRLLSILPRHLSILAQFALETGLRQSNVLGLKWEWIDMANRYICIPAEYSKNNRPLQILLSDKPFLNFSAIEILRQQLGNHHEYAFSYRSRPMVSINNTNFKKYLKKAGIENFRWHDLRHTWASWHIQQGTSLPVLQQLGGWSSYSMVLRYAHLSHHAIRQMIEPGILNTGT